MENAERNQSADELESRPSFRKPLNDASGRNYRRHSPTGGSDASLSDESPKRRRKESPRQGRSRTSDKKIRDDKIDLNRDRYNKTQRDGDSRRHFDRPYKTHRNHYRNDRHGRDRRDDHERSYHTSSKFAHDRNHSPHRRKGYFDKSDEVYQKSDRGYRDGSDDDLRSEDNILDHSASHGYNGSDAALSRSRKVNSRKAEEVVTERDRHRDRKSRDDRRGCHRSPGDHRSHHRSHDDARIRLKDSRGRDLDEREEALDKRKHGRKDYDKDLASNDRKSEEQTRNHDGCNQERRLKNVVDEGGQGVRAQIHQDSKETSEAERPNTISAVFSPEPSIPSIGQVGVINPGAATVAAMKAAEIVNRNLMGGGGLSITEQKRKLLWGSKKNTEESSSQWDLSTFPDRERQEKFRKLMGVKGEAKLETKPDEDDGNVRAKKQEELQMDLEKQYTAGLRRRDGRTVGLGL